MSHLSSVRTLTDGTQAQRVDDRVMLLGSLLMAPAGWLVLVPLADWSNPSARGGMGLVQFAVGFALVTIAFPFGRGLCLAMVGKLLGDQPQGTWMGIMVRRHLAPKQRPRQHLRIRR